MKKSGGDTRDRILEAARRLAREQGLAHLTFDAVAARLGLTKQAVIYWFHNKDELLAAVALPAIREEVEAALRALEHTSDAREATEAFIRGVASFHLADLDRFRMIYLSPQVGLRRGRLTRAEDFDKRVHPITARMYGALEQKLATNKAKDTRRKAVAIHMAVLGLMLMVSLADATDDPLAHDTSDLVDSLVELMAGN